MCQAKAFIMALHYVLDGYNVINQIPEFTNSSLEDRREKFLRWIETSNPQGSLKNQVTVVYDGRPGLCHAPRVSSVRVVFSSNESADETIKRLVLEADYRKSIVVVTNDRDIRYFVRSLGAKILDAESFLGKRTGTNREKAQSRKAGLENKQISRALEHKINSEFTDIWLKKRNSR